MLDAKGNAKETSLGGVIFIELTKIAFVLQWTE